MLPAFIEHPSYIKTHRVLLASDPMCFFGGTWRNGAQQCGDRAALLRCFGKEVHKVLSENLFIDFGDDLGVK